MLTDQPLGLCLWNNNTIRLRDGFKSIGKNEYNPILKGYVLYLSNALKSIHVLNKAAGSVGGYDIW